MMGTCSILYYDFMDILGYVIFYIYLCHVYLTSCMRIPGVLMYASSSWWRFIGNCKECPSSTPSVEACTYLELSLTYVPHPTQSGLVLYISLILVYYLLLYIIETSQLSQLSQGKSDSHLIHSSLSTWTPKHVNTVLKG